MQEVTERPILLFATDAYEGLARLIVSERVRRGEVERHRFPDGERYLRLLTDVRGAHVAVLGGTIDDAGTLELYDLAGSAVIEGARSLTLLIPYFGYSTMERQLWRGEVVTAKLRARLLSSLPPASDGTRVVLLDLHSPGIPFYFEGEVRPVHLSAEPVLIQAIRDLAHGEPFVLGAVDAGGAKRAQGLANQLGVEAGFVFKRRDSGDRVSFTAMHADVRGRPVILIDDMVRTGGSMIQAARAYRDAGATRVAAVATHGVLPGDSAERMAASGVIERLVVTDSHPTAVARQGDFVHVVTIAGLLERWLDRFCEG